MNGPIPTIAFMFSATHSVRPRARSSFSDGRGVDMDDAKRPKHIRCMGGAKAPAQESPSEIRSSAREMMQNRGGVNGAHAKARNYFHGGDRDDSHRGIFPHTAPAITRARVAWPDCTRVRRVPDVSRRRACGHVFQSAGLDGIHFAG